MTNPKRLRTVLTLILSLLLWPSLRAGAAESRGDEELFRLRLSSSLSENLKALRELDPSPDERIYHGKWSRDETGHFVAQPDTAAIAALEREEGLSAEDAQALARFYAKRDEIAQLEAEAAQAETSYRAVLAMPEGPKKGKILSAKHSAQDNHAQRIERLSADAMTDYHALVKNLGEEKTRSVFAQTRKKSEARRVERVGHAEGARRAENAECEEGLKQCKFPDGLVSNCAAYLGMTVDELKRRCPNPGRLEDKR